MLPPSYRAHRLCRAMGWTRTYVDQLPYGQFVEHEAWLNVESNPVAAGGYSDDVAGQIADDRDLYYRQQNGRGDGA